MNRLIQKTVPVLLSAALLSCSTTTKLSISGAPGTQVMSVTGQEVGTIPASGVLKVDRDDDRYDALMVAKAPGQDYVVPFGLNYGYRSVGMTKFSEYFGYTLAGIGLVGVAGGTVALLCVGEDEQTVPLVLMGGGLGVGLLGASFGAPASSRAAQFAYEYSYKYVPHQSVNNDIAFVKPDIKYVSMETSKQPEKSKLRPGAKSQKSDDVVTKHKIKGGKNAAARASGEYVGTGVIYLDDEEVEKLKGLTVRIVSISADAVSVDLIEADGSDFFGSPIEYSVIAKTSKSKSKDKTIRLRHSANPKATITISPNGDLTYIYPNLKIDDETYILKITAERQ